MAKGVQAGEGPALLREPRRRGEEGTTGLLAKGGSSLMQGGGVVCVL